MDEGWIGLACGLLIVGAVVLSYRIGRAQGRPAAPTVEIPPGCEVFEAWEIDGRVCILPLADLLSRERLPRSAKVICRFFAEDMETASRHIGAQFGIDPPPPFRSARRPDKPSPLPEL
jgi:hypothetical protein